MTSRVSTSPVPVQVSMLRGTVMSSRGDTPRCICALGGTHHNLCCSEASPPCLFPHFPFLSGCHIQTDGESACLIFGPLILACSHPINIVVVVGKAVGEWNETSPLAASIAVLDAEVPCACMVCICRWFLATRAACGGWTPSVHKM